SSNERGILPFWLVGRDPGSTPGTEMATQSLVTSSRGATPHCLDGRARNGKAGKAMTPTSFLQRRRWTSRRPRRTRRPADGQPRLEQLYERIAPSASVWTDRPDYQAGQYALITGTGFLPGETVQLQVLHTDGTANTGEGHAPWYVTDGGVGDLDGLVNGSIQTTWYVSPDDSVGSQFQLTAAGLTSGEMASTVFTDANVAANIDQWANGPL